MPTSIPPKKRWRPRPWQETLAIVLFAILCAAVLVWSSFDQSGIPPPP